MKSVLQHARGFFYLATPYSHPDKAVMAQRAMDAHEISAILMADGIKVYSPIWNCHHAAEKHKLPTDAEWWWEFNRAFISRSDGIIVATTMDGWDISKGVRQEIIFAFACEHPVFAYTESGDLVEVPTIDGFPGGGLFL